VKKFKYFNKEISMRFILSSLIILILSFSLLAEEMGEAHIYIFKTDNSAYPGITVKAGGKSTVTDDSGFATLKLPIGKQTVTLSLKDKVLSEVPMNIVAAEITEAILTMGELKEKLDVEVMAEKVVKENAAAKKVELGDSFGTMQGVVTDSKSNEPVADARVFIRGVNSELKTDEKGMFSVQLPVGSYAISVIHSKYTSSTLEALVVEKDKVTNVTASLLPSAVELEGMSVVAVKITGGVAALVEEKRESQKLVEIIGAEQMSKSGDSDAASALKRVSGITVVDGKFIYVRGMGERYSNTLIDGLGLPSPIIERRVVPLDLFPADIIESLVVQKSSTADKPGEFGGGLVEIRTKGIPEKRILSFGMSSTYNSESTFKDGLSHFGGDTDFLGIDDGARDLPSELGGYRSDTLTEQGVDAIRPYWTPENTTIYPSGAGSLSYGDRFGDKIPLGIYTSLSYSNSTKNKDANVVRYQGSTGALTPTSVYDKFETTNNIELGGMLVLGTVIDEKHELQFNSLVLRTTDKKSSKDSGELWLSESGEVGDRYGISWVEQQVTNFALHGKHKFNQEKTNFRWDTSTSEATRDQPDYRFYELHNNAGVLELNNRFTDAFYSPNKLTDEVEDIFMAVDHTFELNKNKLKVETGLASTSKKREYSVRNIDFNPGQDTEAYPLDLLFIEEVDATTNNLITTSTTSANVLQAVQTRNFYNAEQDTSALYLMFDYAHQKEFDVNIGVRYEKNESKIEGKDVGAAITGKIENSDVLPSFNFKYKGLSRHQFRVGYSKTLNRPSFNEISRISLQTFKGEPFYSGFEGIKQAEISNYDLRWEHFLQSGSSDLIAVSPFYKTIDSPIIAAELSTTDTIKYSYGNVNSATLYGVEVDYRQSLSFLMNAWSDFYWTLNLTLVESEIDTANLNFSTTSLSLRDGEALTGQAPIVFNCSVGYDNPDSGLNFALLYNYVGERIVALGKGNEPNTDLSPTHQVDFVVGTKIKDKYSLKFKVQNILNDKYKLTRDDKPTYEYDRGIDVSLGFSVAL